MKSKWIPAEQLASGRNNPIKEKHMSDGQTSGPRLNIGAFTIDDGPSREQINDLFRNLVAHNDLHPESEIHITEASRQYERSESPSIVIETLVDALVANVEEDIQNDIVNLIRFLHREV